MPVPPSVYSFICQWTVGLLQLLATMNNATMNMNYELCSVAKNCLFGNSWTVAHQALLCSTVSQSLLKFMSIDSVMLSHHLILCCPLLFLSSIFPSVGVFSSELALHVRWPKYYSFSFSISTSNEYSGLNSFRIY